MRRVDVGAPATRHRVVQFSDLHHRGGLAYLRRVIDQINALQPDFARFTGDTVEESRYLEEALAEIRRIACPVYGCPANHDYSSGASFMALREAFKATGGRWMEHEQIRVGRNGAIALSVTNFAEPGPARDHPVRDLREAAGRHR